MFNKTYLIGDNRPQNHYHNHNVKITEKRAPTDESLKLLKEIKKEVTDDIVGSYYINNNDLSGSLVVCKNPTYQSYELHIMFKLNNVEYHIEDEIKRFDLLSDREAHNRPVEFLSKKFFDNVSKKISEILFNKNFKEFTQFQPQELI